jgi:hypothetical protein
MDMREGRPGIDEHGSREDDASSHSQEQTSLRTSLGEVLPVEVFLIEVRAETKEGCDTT